MVIRVLGSVGSSAGAPRDRYTAGVLVVLVCRVCVCEFPHRALHPFPSYRYTAAESLLIETEAGDMVIGAMQ